MPLRTYASDRAEEAQPKATRLPYIGGLITLSIAAWAFARSPKLLIPLLLAAGAVLALGASGRLDVLAPLWDGLQRIWPY